jgi:hypothetical protein
MNNLCTEVGYASLSKDGEQLCGDRVEYRVDENGALLALADGLGSGVKACILSTLTAKILMTMIAGGMSVDECVETMANTLPVCKLRGIAYSTFTIIHITDNRRARLIQFDNPTVALIRDGKNCEYPVSVREIGGKRIAESEFEVREGDLLLAMSDGAIYAGAGHAFNYGWSRENILQFIEGNFAPEHSARYYAGIVVDECGKLYEGRPGDDTTVAAVRVRARHPVNLVIGPPAARDADEDMMRRFFALEGTHIVCGGTTAFIAAKYLGKDIVPSEGYSDPSIPPISRLEGADLVTEGVLTMSRVVLIAERRVSGDDAASDFAHKKDGASRIAQELLEQATGVVFFVGRAVNPAHQNPNLPISFGIKIQLIERLTACLRKLNKRVTVYYF